jgi:hypothetical protein
MTHLLATTSILGRSKLQIFNNINRLNQEQKAETAVKLPGPLTAIPQCDLDCLITMRQLQHAGSSRNASNKLGKAIPAAVAGAAGAAAAAATVKPDPATAAGWPAAAAAAAGIGRRLLGTVCIYYMWCYHVPGMGYE